MHAVSRGGRRFGVPATAAVSLVLAGAVPALADESVPPDTTPPVVTSTGLTDGQILTRQPVLHPVATDDLAVTRVAVRVGTNSTFRCTMDASQAVSCPLTIPTSLNGTDVDVLVRAFDAAGNHGDMTTRVHVVSVALSGTLTPKAGTAMRSGPVTATLSDVSTQTTKIEMTDGVDGAVLATLTAAPWTFTWDAAETATPPCFRLSEPFGNITTYCSKYVVSDEPPVIKDVIAFGYYTDWQWDSKLEDGTGWLGADASIYSEIADKVGIDHTELWVDGVLQGTSTAKVPTFVWHDTTPGKTSANLEVRVSDRLGLTTTQSFRANIDNAGPVLKVWPPNGRLVRGTQLVVTETATDRHRIYLPALHLSGMPLLTSPTSWQYMLYFHKDGPIPVGYVGYDEYGNSTTLTSAVIVDNTPPGIAFAKAPKNHARLKSTVRFTAATSDKNGIAKVQLLVNGHVIAASTDPRHTFALASSKYGKRFTVAFRAYDKAGNHRDTTTRHYTHK